MNPYCIFIFQNVVCLFDKSIYIYVGIMLKKICNINSKYLFLQIRIIMPKEIKIIYDTKG